MAIVQISRIQHRRGRKNQGSGIPQLASGEIGWAIDTQEVYIGNGAVSEGAPAVGNTKLLTEADNLLSLAGQYAYKRDEIQTGVALASPVERTLQAKLDDRVSVRDFGAMGDGTDQTEKLQRAIDQLFINSATKGLYSSRLTLYIPAGEYLISSPGLKIPPYANIVGDGIDKTFLNSSGANPPENIFRTVNELSIPGTYADPSTTTSANMARFVRIEGMTIFHNSNGGALYLENCQNSMFTDMKISAGWGTGDGVTSEGVPGSNLVGIVVSNGSVATATSDYNIFKNIFINGFACAVYSEYDINNNKFLGDIYGDSITGFFEFDGDSNAFTIQGDPTNTFGIDNSNYNVDVTGNSNTFTLDHGTTALAATLDLDWIIQGDDNTFDFDINYDGATNYVDVDGDDNTVTFKGSGYAGGYFYLDQTGNSRTFNIQQLSTQDNDWLKIISNGNNGTVCVIQNDQGTSTSC